MQHEEIQRLFFNEIANVYGHNQFIYIAENHQPLNALYHSIFF